MIEAMINLIRSTTVKIKQIWKKLCKGIRSLWHDIKTVWKNTPSYEDDISINSFEIYDKEGDTEDAFVQILKEIQGDHNDEMPKTVVKPLVDERVPKVKVYTKNKVLTIELNINIRTTEGIDSYDKEMDNRLVTYIEEGKIGVISSIKMRGFSAKVYTDKIREMQTGDTLLTLFQLNPYIYIDRQVTCDPVTYKGKFVNNRANIIVKYMNKALCRAMVTTVVQVVRFHKHRKNKITDEVAMIVLLLDYSEELVYIGGIVGVGDHVFIIVRSIPVKQIRKCYVLASSLLMYDVEVNIKTIYGQEC